MPNVMYIARHVLQRRRLQWHPAGIVGLTCLYWCCLCGQQTMPVKAAALDAGVWQMLPRTVLTEPAFASSFCRHAIRLPKQCGFNVCRSIMLVRSHNRVQVKRARPALIQFQLYSTYVSIASRYLAAGSEHALVMNKMKKSRVKETHIAD